jgi:5-methylcytosine-specific restriction endonuclease McrA
MKMQKHKTGCPLFYNVGKKHPAYKNGTSKGHNYSMVKKSIDLLGKNCQQCGSGRYVVLHHRDGNPRNNELKNWQRLCQSCHVKLHWGFQGKVRLHGRMIKRKKLKELLQAYVLAYSVKKT